MRKILVIIIFFFSTFGFSQKQEIISFYKQAEKFKKQGDFKQAENTYQLVIKKVIIFYGKKSELYPLYLNSLAVLYQDLEQSEKALPLFKETFDILKKTHKNEHPDYIIVLENLANTYYDLEQYRKALPLYLKNLNIITKTVGKAQNDYLYVLENIASCYSHMEQYEKALPLYQQAFEFVKQKHTKEHPDYLFALENLASLYDNLEQFNNALSLYLEIYNVLKRTKNKNDLDYQTSLVNLAFVYINLKEYKKALPLYLEAFESFKKKYGENHSDYISILKRLISLYDDLEQYEDAIDLELELFEIIKKKKSKTHPDYQKIVGNLATLYDKSNQYNKAIPFAITSLGNIEQTKGKDNLEYSENLNTLANLYFNSSNYKKAIPLYLEALKITEKKLGKRNSKYISLLSNLATCYNSIEHYEQSLNLHLKSLTLAKIHLGKDKSGYGTSLNNLASFYFEIGQYKKALSHFLEVVENTKNTLGENNERYASSLGNLAVLYNKNGLYEKALKTEKKALEITKRILGKKHPNYGIHLNNLSLSYRAMEKFDDALQSSLEALENTKNSFGKNHIEYGVRLNNLASIYDALGKQDKAIQLYTEGLENTKKILGENHSDYRESLNNLAYLYIKIEKFEEALLLLKEARKNYLNEIKRNFSFQSEMEKEQFITNVIGGNLGVYSEFNYKSKNKFNESITIATNNILIAKGLLLNASKNILSKLEDLNDNEINKKIEFFRAKKAFINKQSQLPIHKRIQLFKSEREQLEKLERELVKLHNKYFNEEINYIKDWQKNKLKENDIAIEYTYFYVNKDSIMYVAYLYKKDWNRPKVINLFEEKQLAKHFSTISNPNKLYASRGIITKSNKAKLAVADSIYKLVWKPLEKYVKNSSTIYFSPDGLLHKIPFAALPNENNQLIGEKYNIQQMGNTADVGTNNKQPNLENVLLIGGVKYDYKEDTSKPKQEYTYSILENEALLGNEKNRSISKNGFEYLPGTKKEIRDINSIFNNANQLSGYNATETAFKKLSGKSPSILHIATHGFFFKKPKKQPKQNKLLVKENKYKQHENPLLRSGLLFANANYAWKNGNNPYEEDDGILTALEISNLDLKNTDIVILSACETGLGDIEGSEGVYGLQRAFKMAGVKTIIMSLWEVPDAETAEFMNLFYTNWKALNNPKKAFKKTQSIMMKKYRDTPEKWAAFVLFE